MGKPSPVIRRLFPDGFPPAEPAPSGSWGRPLIAAAGLAVLVTFLYWPAVDFRLLSFDDQYYTVQNDLIAGGLNGANIVRAFTRLPEENLFIPLTQLSYMADVELFGMAPRGFHFTSIVLHAIDMALLLLVLWRMTGSLGKSAIAVALVAFHPLRVESVAWVTERKGVLSVFFLLLSLSCYLRYARTRKWGWYGAVLFCCVLGMLAKPILVTLPFLLLLLDFWPLGRFREEPGEGSPPSFGRRLLALAAEKVPLAAVSVLISLATVHLQKMSLHPGISLVSRLEHAFSAVFVYLFQTVWPQDLAFRYFDTPWERFSGALLPAAAGFLILTVIVVRFAGGRPYLAFGWSWYLVALFPNSGIVPSGIQWISDRFTYVPHIGLAVALVWLADGILARRSRLALPVLAVILLLPLAILSRSQLYFWKDGAALFGRGVAYNSQDPRYIAQYAGELAFLGDLPRARAQLESIRRFALNPEFGINIQLGYMSIFDRLGDRKGAIEQARGFLREDPGFWKTRLHLADDLLAEKRFAEAAAEYRTVLEVGPVPSYERGYALEGLGLSLWRMEKFDEALVFYNEGLRSTPRSVSLHYNMARLLDDRGEAGSARVHYEEAVRIAPGNVRARMALAEHLMKVGLIEAAAFQFQEAARFAPSTAEALFAQGRIMEAAGMKTQAESLYENALKAPVVLPDTIDAVRRRLEKRP
jgi:tetratricopeptide (TPR) repeat protein